MKYIKFFMTNDIILCLIVTNKDTIIHNSQKYEEIGHSMTPFTKHRKLTVHSIYLILPFINLLFAFA